MEQLGVLELEKLGLVLIAGGMGERLGYSGIKIGLPVCTIEPNYSYLRYYCQYAKACRDRALKWLDPAKDHSKFYVPLCIMVSQETHNRTIEMLEENNYFGMDKSHIDIVK